MIPQQQTELWINLMRQRLKYLPKGVYTLEFEYYLKKIEENLHDEKIVDDCIYSLQMLRIQKQQENSIMN